MLDRLPVELLRLVVREAAPLAYRSSTYKERQAALQSLSLVSRRVKSVAQPVLGQVVLAHLVLFLSAYEGVKHEPGGAELLSPPVLRHSWNRLAEVVQVLVLQPSNLDGVCSLPPEIGWCRSLRDLTLGIMDANLKDIALHPHLQRLVLMDCTLSCDQPPPVFPSLTELSLSVATIDLDIGPPSTFFSQQHFPSLRRLGAFDIRIGSNPDVPGVLLEPHRWATPPVFAVGGPEQPDLQDPHLDVSRTVWVVELIDSDHIHLPYFPPHLYLRGDPFFLASDRLTNADGDGLTLRLHDLAEMLAEHLVAAPARTPSTLILPYDLEAVDHDGLQATLARLLRLFERATVLRDEAGLASYLVIPMAFIEHQQQTVAEKEQEEQ